MSPTRTLLVVASTVGTVLLALVAVVDGLAVAAHERRYEGGWMTGWDTLTGVVVTLLLATPAVVGGLGVLLVRRRPRGAGVCLLLAGLGGLVVGVLSLLGSVGWGLVTLPVAVLCTLAFVELTRSPRPTSHGR
jgi:hypothetical protein